jgi:tRNA(Ile)-lysidine synthase
MGRAPPAAIPPPAAVSAGEAAPPLDAAAFAALMALLGPFERNPCLAVAVSGGADSLALCLLADAWARERDGSIVALTVDHGLRAEAAGEAARVGRWLALRGIRHHVLTWRPPAGLRNIQAAARAARYELLFAWCAASGCLHLLTAHHREDQAETLLLRLARGSGLDGLAGMAPSRETPACRLLRPLLPVPRARLVASLRQAGQGWIEDPSNRDHVYARVRLRAGAGLLAREGLSPARLAATARHLGRARAALEDSVTRRLAEAVRLHPAGFAVLAADRLAAAPSEIALRGLARLAATIGGADHPPRLERLERLLAALCDGLAAGRTLAGCRFLPWRGPGSVLVCREAGAAPTQALIPGLAFRWDGRFEVALAADAPQGMTIGALAGAGFGRDEAAASGRPAVPAAARAALPALRDLVGVAAVPHLNYIRPDFARSVPNAMVSVAFRPRWPLTAPGFTVV